MMSVQVLRLRVLIALPLCAFTLHCAAQESSQYFYSGGKKHKVKVRMNEIGVVARGDNTIFETMPLVAERLDFKVSPSPLSGFSVLSSSKSLGLPDLERRCRELTLDSPKSAKPKAALSAHRYSVSAGRDSVSSIAHAGLIARLDSSSTPFLVTSAFVIQFREDVPAERRRQIIDEHKLVVIEDSGCPDCPVLVRSTGGSGVGFFDGPNEIHVLEEVEYSHPALVHGIETYGDPDDPAFDKQWHHKNTGQNAGTNDADIDTDGAWDFTTGDPGLVVAVIDEGFQLGHPDLKPNLWVNIDEVDGNLVDDDSNGCPDDIHGWNFSANDHSLTSPFNHGTSVAGCVGASGGNGLGVSGTSQHCKLMMLKVDPVNQYQFNLAKAFRYAAENGASVITCSMGVPSGVPLENSLIKAIEDAAKEGRDGKGIPVFLSARNDNVDVSKVCKLVQLPSLASVIGVTGASNCDRFIQTAYGKSLDILGPSFSNTTPVPRDRMAITTLKVGGVTENAKHNSMATPIVAGVAALMLSVDPDLTRTEVQHAIQDTADRVEDVHGEYSHLNGYSGSGTHTNGRANALEAVQLVAPVSNGGLGGVDIFLRDHPLDWGNTAEPTNVWFQSAYRCGLRGLIAHWDSVDIKVDAPPFQAAPGDSHSFETSFSDEPPVANQQHQVAVRIRNRGPRIADEFTVKLHWAVGVAPPKLPSDFWTRFPDDPIGGSPWHPIKAESRTMLEYCGASVAGMAQDAAEVVTFLWDVPPAASPNPTYWLFVVADSPQNRIGDDVQASNDVDFATTHDNNITLRKVGYQFGPSPDTPCPVYRPPTQIRVSNFR